MATSSAVVLGGSPGGPVGTRWWLSFDGGVGALEAVLEGGHGQFEGTHLPFGRSGPLVGCVGLLAGRSELLLQLGDLGDQTAVSGVLLASGEAGPVGGLALRVGGIQTLPGHQPAQPTRP